MKIMKRLLSVLLIAVLLLPLVPASAAGVTLTAVNDTLLPLKSSTMPTRRSGDIYVPYSVFTGTLGLRAFYDDQQQILVIQNSSTTLTFSLSQSYVYDQNMTSYSSPAYSIGGAIFVPVKLICNQFGLSYSVISATDADVLRICNDNAVLSDHVFVNSAAGKINDAVATYLGKPSGGGSGGGAAAPSGSGTTPSVPPEVLPPSTVDPTAPVLRPSLVYLAVCGAPNKYTPGILEALHNAGRPSTFFLPAAEKWSGEQLRTIALDGHSFGLLISTADADNIALLTDANAQLALETGLTSHVVMIEGGSQQLSQAQRDALIGAGYRLWDATLAAAESSRSAPKTARIILDSFAATTAVSVLGLSHTENTAAVLNWVLQDMAAHHVASSCITLVDSPINLAREKR